MRKRMQRNEQMSNMDAVSSNNSSSSSRSVTIRSDRVNFVRLPIAVLSVSVIIKRALGV